MDKRRLRQIAKIIIVVTLAAVIISIITSVTVYSADDKEFLRPDLIPCIEQVSEQYGVSPELIEAMIETESRGISSVSNGTCIGLMQVSTRWHSDRAKRLGVDIHTDAGNILCGVDYLMEMAAENEDLYLVLGKYNGQRTAAEGVPNGYANEILARANELERVHGKRSYEIR